MAIEESLNDNRIRVRRALEVTIHVGLALLLTAACLLILRPFLPLVAWGIVIAIAVYPAYRKLRSLLGGRGTLAAVLFALIFLAILIVPVALLTETMIEGIGTLSAHIKDGTLSIPPPPANVGSWPLIGPPLAKSWNMASTNLTGLVTRLSPQIRALVAGVVSAWAGLGVTGLLFVLSIVVAAVLLANASGCATVSRSLANRLFGDQGPEFEELAGSTIAALQTESLVLPSSKQYAPALGVWWPDCPAPDCGRWSSSSLQCFNLEGRFLFCPSFMCLRSTARRRQSCF